MKKIGVILMVVVLTAGTGIASPPAPPPPGWTPPELVEGRGLAVTWDDSQGAPLVLTWIDKTAQDEMVFIDEGQPSVFMTRKGWDSLPENLLAVPAGNRLRPQIIDVPADAETVHVVFEPIAPHEVWFWGITPKNPCPLGGKFLSIIVRLIHRTQTHASFHGIFIWNIVLTPEDKHEIAFYFSPEQTHALKAITAQGFKKANDISHAFCMIRTGGECPFTMETNPDAWGKLHRIEFEVNKEFNEHHCPI